MNIITLETLLGLGLVYFTSDETTRMRNTLLAGGIGAIFYFNTNLDKEKNNVLNYRIQ